LCVENLPSICSRSSHFNIFANDSRSMQQAQLYYAGKSRYIGVFDSREKACLAYEISREVLKTDKGEEPKSSEIEANINLARKAAFAGVAKN
jgi:hypothetical protein